MFDLEERFHLALHAGSVGQHDVCMTHLKEILQQQPEHACAVYLLAVQHSELGLHERAVRGLQAALAIDPELQIARFHIGMLLLDQQRRSEARESFAALGGSSDAELRLFAEAMIALLDDDLKVAQEKLTTGVASPACNHALGGLMLHVLRTISEIEPVVSGSAAQDGRVSLGACGRAPSTCTD
jgi:tetratricopeptide (TPR) repeat protein